MKFLQIILIFIAANIGVSTYADNWTNMSIANLKCKCFANNPKAPFKYGVIVLHGMVVNAANKFQGVDAIIEQSTTDADNPNSMKMMMDKFAADNAFVVLPVAELKKSKNENVSVWNFDNKDGGTERDNIIALINLMHSPPYNIKKIFLMGGSAGAVMTHNVAKYLINNPKTIKKGTLAGIVIADGISSDLISSSKDDAPSIVKKCCDCLKYNIDKLKVESLANLYRLPPKYYNSENIAGIASKSWTLPTLILYSKNDQYGPDNYKLEFANALKEKEFPKGIVKVKASGEKHQPWGAGQLDILLFIDKNL